MKFPRKVGLIFLALFILFLGSFSATLLIGRVSLASAAANTPLAKTPSIVTKTVNLNAGGFTCNDPVIPANAGGEAMGGAFCIVDSVPLAQPPVGITCVFTEPSIDTGWRDCQGYVITKAGSFNMAVIWLNQKLDLMIAGNGATVTDNITVMYSAVV